MMADHDNVQTMKEDNMVLEAERLDDLEVTKAEGNDFTPEDEKRLVRKLDLW